MLVLLHRKGPKAKSVYNCETCGYGTNFSASYQTHLKNCKPLKRVDGSTDNYYCAVCDANLGSKAGYRVHIDGRKHKKREAEVNHMKRVFLLSEDHTGADNIPTKQVPGQRFPNILLLFF